MILDEESFDPSEVVAFDEFADQEKADLGFRVEHVVETQKKKYQKFEDLGKKMFFKEE